MPEDPKPPIQRARLEEAEGRILLVPRSGGNPYPLPTYMGRKVMAMWKHQLEHGEVDAETYLMGVGHGLMASIEAQIEQVASRSRIRRLAAEGGADA